MTEAAAVVTLGRSSERQFEIAFTITLVVVGAVVLGLGLLVYRLLVDRGRLLLQIEALESRILSEFRIPDGDEVDTVGFPVGGPAPDFALPDLSGTERPLEEWRGDPVLLVFFDPECRFCRELLPRLASTPAAHTTVIVSTGDAGRMRALTEEHGLAHTVLVQQANEVSESFRIPGTPAAYLLDEHGLIAEPMALGIDGVLELAVGRKPRNDPAETSKLHLRPLSRSRLLRTGLEAGTPAPPFSLPALDGGTISLDDYRGRRVLLAFVDPDCAPCEELAPQLEQLHRERDDFDVVAISRGDRDDNRAKVEEHGLTYPIALQRHWDTSKDYGMFAVPVAYLVDEDGVLVSNAAVGPGPIVELAAEKEVSKA